MSREQTHKPMTAEQMQEFQESRKTTRFYREASAEFVDSQLSEIVSNGTEQFKHYQDRQIKLADTSAVRSIAEQYLEVCVTTSTLPTITGLARSLGLTYQGLHKWKSVHSTHPTADYLEAFGDLCSDLLADAGLRNAVNPITGIFIQKARYGLRDTVTLEIPQQSNLLGEYQDAEAIAERYKLLSEGENDI